MSFFRHFLPHPETHQKSPLLSWYALLIYVLMFLGLQGGFQLLDKYAPGTLGITTSITPSEIIERTNVERQKQGLSILKENPALDSAALAKAKNMFEEDYWAHFSPSGKDPWGFIKTSGYHFTYAGENLAKNFSNADDTVKAWMASPSHRDNLMQSKYQDIGVAVLEGELKGQKTVLVVQMFGTPYQPMAAAPPQQPVAQKQPNIDVKVSESPLPVAQAIPQQSQTQGISLNTKPLIDSTLLNKTVATAMVFFIALMLTLDIVVLKKRGVFRFSSHHVAHLSLLAFTGTTVFTSTLGEIL